jgi:hypothetical protein
VTVQDGSVRVKLQIWDTVRFLFYFIFLEHAHANAVYIISPFPPSLLLFRLLRDRHRPIPKHTPY